MHGRSAREGLISPLDVLRDKIKETVQASTAGKMQITLPPKSGIFLLEDPAFGRLVGTPPEDGTSDDRSNAIRFEEGEAVFSIGHYQRGLVAVQLDFTVHADTKSPIDPQSYRYASSSGVIEVVEHRLDLGGKQVFLTQHRKNKG